MCPFLLSLEKRIVTVYAYDGYGRLTAVKSGVVDTNNQTLAENVKTVKDYRYAANGDLTESREYLEFDTKEDKQGVTLTQSYVYDAVGRPTDVGRILRTFKIKKNVEVTDNGKDNF